MIGTFLLLCGAVPSVAQEIAGWVRSAADSSALPGALVLIEETGEGAVVAADGFFRFPLTSRGAYTLTVRMLGYQPQSERIEVADSLLKFYLAERRLTLDEVTVTAREAPLGSVSRIEGYALQHTQPVSLADVLQLVPGQLAVNPELGDVAQFTLRQAAVSRGNQRAPTGVAAQRANAFGTALLLDGAPVSNNANLQINQNVLNAAPGSLPPFASTAGRGLDLRQIPADLIESVEVIRGVAPARYGDLTAGAVLVNTRVGAYRPRLRVRVNPTVRQLAGGGGWQVGDRAHVNVEADLARAVTDPRDDLERYTRLNVQTGATHRLAPSLTLTHRLTVFTSFDQARKAPEDDMTRRSHYQRDRGLRFNSQGTWRTVRLDLNYVAAVSYQHQEGYFQSLVTRDIFPVTDALTDTTRPGIYGRSEYLNQTQVYGRPLNGYLRLEANRTYRAAGRHRLTAGLEGRHDSNRGGGRQFDPLTPPRQNYSLGDRPRAFRDVPALNQGALYVSDRWATVGWRRPLVVEAGVRADLLRQVPPPGLDAPARWDFYPAPRLNAALSLTERWQARLGWGVQTKIPPLALLYPLPVYFDLVNFNYFAPEPSERLVVLTTRRLVPDTRALRPYQARKWEAGLYRAPADAGGWELALTFFHERTDGAYTVLRQVIPIENPTFEATDFPSGAPPLLSPIPARLDTFMAAYDLPRNELSVVNQGSDFTVQTPELPGWRTRLHLTGALLHTRSQQTTPFLDANRAVFSNQFDGQVPIFPAGQGEEVVRFNTSLRLVHHLPALGFVVSGLVQTIWVEQDRRTGWVDTPVAYVDRTGATVPIPTGDFTEEQRERLGRIVEPELRAWQRRPPLWLFNVRVTKEWNAGRGFAFYVNNVVNSRPLYDANVAANVAGFRLPREQPEFFFGAEVFYTL